MRVYDHILIVSILVMVIAPAVVNADQTLSLYDGTMTAVELGSWGTGKITESEEVKYQDNNVLEVETKGYYEGGRLELKEPADFSVFGKQPNNVQIIAVVKAAEAQAPPAYGPGAFPGVPGYGPTLPGGIPGVGPMPGQPWPGGVPEGPMPPGYGPGMGAPGPPMPGMGMPTQPGMPGMPGIPGMGPGPGMPSGYGYQPPAEPVDNIRIVLVTDRGQLDSGALELDPNTVAEEEWIRVARVLSDCKGAQQLEGAKLLRVVLCGNREGNFYVANLRIVQEDKPLVAQIEGEQRRRASLQQQATFNAAPQMEGVEAKYIWDFDDLDGLSEDAYGQQVSCQFPEAGYYVVTLTVTDKAGQRERRTDRTFVIVE